MDTTSSNFSKEISNDMAAFITKTLSEQRRSAGLVNNSPPPEVTRRVTTTSPTFHEPDFTQNKKAPTNSGGISGSTIEFFCYKDGEIGTVKLDLSTPFSKLE